MRPDFQVAAAVWDMDGLLLDTERLSFIAWSEGASEMGLEIGEPLFHSLIGMNAKRIQDTLLDALGPEIDVIELTSRAGRHYDRLIEQGPPLKPGASQCLEALSRLNVPQALATSSSRRYAERKLGHHGLLKHFKTLVTGDQVAHGKPHPEPYLTAAERLGVDPEQCVALEDSVNGIRSAHAAGMRTVLVPDLSRHDEASLARVWKQFDSLVDALPFLEALFAK